MRLSVRLSIAAQEQVATAKAAAEASPQSRQAAFWRQIKRALVDFLPHENLALGPGTALKGNFRGIRRMDIAGRHRLFYLANSTTGVAIVLFIGFRKAGDKNDAYEEFARLLSAGRFDDCFTDAGVEKP